MKRTISIFSALIFLIACQKDFLVVTPENVISEENLDPEQLVVSAYSGLDYRFNTGEFRDDWPFDHAPSNWAFSDIRSGDAYKGGGGVGDNPGGGMHSLEIHQVFPSSENVYNLWRAVYFGIYRINSAIISLNNDEGFSNREIRVAELKVLRAHFYFELMKNFGSFAYIDENTPIDQVTKVENSFDTALLWSHIEADLQAGIDALPDSQTDLGRVNKMVAHAFMAKAKLFQQNWQAAFDHADIVISSGNYSLVSDIERLYSSPGYGNSENVFAIQYSVDDGSNFGNLNFGDLLNSPDSPADDTNHPYLNGDDFHKPTQNIVNAFKVDANGLPLLENYNNSDLDPEDTTTPVDPRLDHSIGRPGITWKKWTAMSQQDNWSRDIPTYGKYLRKKNQIDPYDTSRPSQGFPWAKGALDHPIIKLSDVMLWKAEAAIELGNVSEGINIINQIRTRALNSPRVYDFNDNTSDAANYQIGLYSTDVTQQYATTALRMERRLELHNEGHHFYDLVRWGIASSWINDYMFTESAKRLYYSGAQFDAARDEYLPIPQIEIDASAGVYQQRSGY